MNTVLPAPERPVTPSRTVGLNRPNPNSPSARPARRISSVMSVREGTGCQIRPWGLPHQPGFLLWTAHMVDALPSAASAEHLTDALRRCGALGSGRVREVTIKDAGN